MSKQSVQRVAEEIRKEVSAIMRTELKDPELIKMTSITGVDVSKDLRHAKIFVSVFGDTEEQNKIIRVLDKAAGFIRTELGKRIRLRHTPGIEFRLDKSMEHAANIDRMLKDLNQDSEVEKQGE